MFSLNRIHFDMPSFQNRKHAHFFFSTLVFLSVIFVVWHVMTLYAVPFQSFFSTSIHLDVADLGADNATLGVFRPSTSLLRLANNYSSKLYWPSLATEALEATPYSVKTASSVPPT